MHIQAHRSTHTTTTTPPSTNIKIKLSAKCYGSLRDGPLIPGISRVCQKKEMTNGIPSRLKALSLGSMFNTCLTYTGTINTLSLKAKKSDQKRNVPFTEYLRSFARWVKVWSMSQQVMEKPLIYSRSGAGGQSRTQQTQLAKKQALKQEVAMEIQNTKICTFGKHLGLLLNECVWKALSMTCPQTYFSSKYS